jgi:hypothetical protein
LRVQTSAEKRKPEERELQRQGTAALDPRVDSEFVLTISAQIQGASTERYINFRSAEGKPAAKPTFKIVDASGRIVGSGNLEFG